MTTPASDPGALTGKRLGCWYVVAFAGQGNGGNLWQCVCGRHGVERIIPERTLRDHKINSLRLPCRCDESAGVLTRRVFGLWTVLGPARPVGKSRRCIKGQWWECRCACGTQAAIAREDLASGQALSCGCRPSDEVARDLESRRRRAADRVWKAGMQVDRSRIDRGWKAAMGRALRAFQPQCINCGTPEDLTTHHVQPVSHGHGLRPGNAVRLCRACNSFICDREVGELDPDMAGRLLNATASFEAFWGRSCPAGEVFTVAPPEAPKAPDPALVALLRAVECGAPGAVHTLAAWLEERGDSRAGAIRDVAGQDAVLGEGATHGEQFQRDDKPCAPQAVFGPASPGDAEESAAERVRLLLRGRQNRDVLERLGLSCSQASALQEYLGLRPGSAASTIEEMARRAGIKSQSVRNQINLGLHNLVSPAAAERQEARRKRVQEEMAAHLSSAAAHIKEG